MDGERRKRIYSPEQRKKATERARVWRLAHPEESREHYRKFRERHPERIKESLRKYREAHPHYWVAWQQERKREMVAAYGGECACCGETEIAFLSLDHILGGGHRERVAMGNSVVMRQLRDAGWPKDLYRLLCMNCQFGTMRGRVCPHQAN